MVRFKQWVRENLPLLVVFVFFVVFMLSFLAPRIFITVPAGHEAVLFSRFSGGTEVDTTYKEGLQVFYPWNTVTIYSLREQVLNLDLTALTKDGLSVQVGVSVRFQPNSRLLGTLHKEHGPKYIESFLSPEVESATRHIIGSNKPAELYSTARNLIEAQIEHLLQNELRQFEEFDNRDWPTPPRHALIEAEKAHVSDRKDDNVRMILKYIEDRPRHAELADTLRDAGFINLFESYLSIESVVQQARVNLRRSIKELEVERDRLAALVAGNEQADRDSENDRKRKELVGQIEEKETDLNNLNTAVEVGEKRLNNMRRVYDHFFMAIELKDILITHIELPEKIRDAIQSKLHQEQIAQEFDFRLQREAKEAERKRIEAGGIRDFQEEVSAGIAEGLLKWKAIEATLALAKSNNAKMVVIGAGKDGLPIILGNEGWGNSTSGSNDTTDAVQPTRNEGSR